MIYQQDASITWCDLFRPKFGQKTPEMISVHDVWEPWKQALLASRDVIISSQFAAQICRGFFTLGDGCWLPNLFFRKCYSTSISWFDLMWMPKSTPQQGRARRIRRWGPGGLCIINTSQKYSLEMGGLGAAVEGFPKFQRGEAFLLTVGAFLLTVKLLCLQSLKALIRLSFPL